MLLVLMTISLTSFAEDGTIQELQANVTITKSKADKNAADIDNLKGGLPAEVAARIAADENLQNQIDNIQLPPGPQGEAGPAGPQGLQGERGPAGPSGNPAGQVCSEGYVIGFDNEGNIICSNSPAVKGRLVFVTSGEFTGDLGGVEGADHLCMDAASSAGLVGTFKAWLSDDTSSPDSTFTRSTENYTLINKTIIADNWTQLTSSAPSTSNPINIDEFGNAIQGLVWTNTNFDGTPIATGEEEFYSCYGFTSDQDIEGHGATVGSTEEAGSNSNYNWTGSATQGCSEYARLYCFEQ